MVRSTNTGFYEEHRHELGTFIEIFGIDPSYADNLSSLVAVTQPWVKGDHALPENKVDIKPGQSELLHEYYARFGLKEAMPLPLADFDQILVLGGIHRGNNRRLEFVKSGVASGEVSAERIILLGGERKPYWDVETSQIDENIDTLRAKKIADPKVEEIVRDKPKIRSETDLLRLAAAVHLGELTLKTTTQNGVEYDMGGTQVIITHTAAVIRPNGEPRHTTEACIKDWARTFGREVTGRVGFVATNPHIRRTAHVAQKVIDASEAAGVVLEAAGPAAMDTYSHELFRGEVARLLYEDNKAG